MEYVIADTHFGHKGSLNWPNEAARPFNSIEEMNNTIIKRWNAIVSDDDTVYFLGDFAYKCSNSLLKYVFDTLKGKIIFIKGNHDGKVLKANQKYHRFESVQDRLIIERQCKIIVMDHYPIQSWQGKHRGSIHLHGHTHNRPTNIDGNIMNVSCEAINYTPISLESIIEKFEKHIESPPSSLAL